MQHIVPFSGGFDSFYILHKLANNKLQGVTVDETDEIIAVTVFSKTLLTFSKYKEETRAVEKLKEYFTGSKVRFEQIEINCDVNHIQHMRQGSYQSLLWILAISPYMVSGSRIYLGHL